MGFSFSMDDFVECGAYDGINTGWNPVNPRVAKEAVYKRKMRQRAVLMDMALQYSKARKINDVETVKRTKEQIERELTELESQVYYYRICEKNLLRVINRFSMKSVVISDIIEGLLEFFDESCDSIIELQEEIRNNTKVKFRATPKEVNELNIKIELAQTIFDVVDSGITNGLPLSREMFRYLVKDLEKVLEVLVYNEKVKKKQVEEYFMNHCKKQIGMIVCQNCNTPMLSGIPYCFKCFEGRYS